MLIQRAFFCVFAFVSLLPASLPVDAQTIPAPDGAKFVVRIDLAAIQKTNLGKKLVASVREMVVQEFGDEQDPDTAFQGIEKALGFDPFDELRSITLFGKNIENPVDGIQGVLGMGSTTGNLEGLLLALPGYDSSEYGDHTIHAVAPEGELRVYASIQGERDKRVAVATKQRDVESLLDALNQRSTSPSDVGNSRSKDKSALISVRFIDMPSFGDMDGPPKAVLKMIQDASLSVRAYGDDLEVEVKIETDSEKHAEQMQQLAQGAAAMVSLAKDSEDDEELELIAGILETLEAEHKEKSVRLGVKIPEDLVIKFLREEADLPLAP